MKKKIMPCLLAGALLFSIHSTVKATTGSAIETEINKIVSDDGYQSFVKYESTTEKSGATKLLGSVFAQIAQNNEQISVGSSYIPSFKSNLTVKNQKAEAETNECWANSFTSAFEAYNYAHNTADKGEVYSARHINLWANADFLDGMRTAGRFARNAVGSAGGNYEMATAYATQGHGPVLEDDMPSNRKVTAVPFSSLQTANGQRKELNGYVQFPPVYKAIINGSNIVKYYNSFSYDTPYTTGGNLLDWCDDEITDIDSYRNKVKSQIEQNGSVGAYIMQYDGDKDIFVKAKYDTSTKLFKKYNHAVLIVGWDDNYFPTTNSGVDFTGDTAWAHPGAYIALNSYGKDKYYDGYVYISYDDFYVEQKLYGMTDISKEKYDNVYYYDELGCPTECSFRCNEITVENIFERTTSNNENLTQVAITSDRNQTADVYYTEDFDSDGLPANYKLIKQNVSLQIGGTPINIADIKLTKNKFAIAVTYKNNSTSVFLPVEILGRGDIYEYAVVNRGESYIINTSDDYKFDKNGNYNHISEIMSNNKNYLFNVGIKAYTKEISNTEPDPTPTPTPTPTELVIISTQYKVNNQNKMITRLPIGTTVEDFKSKITVNQEYTITDKNGNDITTTLMRTGYRLKVGTIYYDISVVADISGSGGNSYTRVLDLAKMRSHLIEKDVLTGAYLEAADTNGNGTVDASDLSRIRKISIE